MRILFVHEVNYREKVIFEMHDFPELLSLAGNDVMFVDFAEGVEHSGWRRYLDWRTETSIVEERAHSGASVEVRTPGRLLPPPLDRLVASITQVPAIVRAVRDHKPDVLVLYAVPTNGWQAVMVARRMGVPVLFRALDISHELRPTVFDRLVERAERFIYRSVSTVSANNRALADYVASKGALERNVRVDYPGIDLERFSPGIRSEALLARYGLGPDDQIVQFMGTLYRFAGLDWLIDELAPMLRSQPHRKLVLVGGGEAEAELRAQVDRLGLQASVLFTGWIGYDELADHLRLADVAVTPFAEKLVANCALPSKILQYAGCGIPTVCTRLDGMRGMIAEGDGVLYRAPGDDFSSAITAWLDDNEGRRCAGAKARLEIERLCQWDTAVAGFEDALRQAIGTGDNGAHTQEAVMTICAHDEWLDRSGTIGGDYRRCRRCGLEEQLSLSAVADRFAESQDEWYRASDPACLTPFALALSEQDAAYRLEILKAAIPSGRLLEVGPGSGQFAEAAMKAGYQVTAIEDSAVLVEAVRARGVEVLQGTFESLELEDASFDIVVSWHVIEHVLEPIEFLEQAAQVTKPGGLIILGTPNASSFEHRIARRWSPNYSQPHLRLYTRESLTDVLSQSGWNLVDSFTTDEPEHWLKVGAGLVRLALGRGAAATPDVEAPQALAVQSIEAGKGMLVVRVVGALTALPRWAQVRFGKGNEVVVIGRRQRS